jgi:hypothetical protein
LLHISQIEPGQQVYVAISPLWRVTPQIVRGKVIQVVSKGRRLRGYERTVFVGRIDNNNPASGSLELSTEQGVLSLPYVALDLLQLIIPITTLVETAPVSHPGAQALGTKLIGGTLMPPRYKLSPIKF